MIALLAAIALTSLPSGFVEVTDPRIEVEMAYLGSENFLGRPVDGYEANVCILRAEVAEALSRVQDSLDGTGLSLKVLDCYRPQRAVDDFARFSANGEEGRKAIHFPDVDKADFAKLGYVAKKSSHSQGVAVDLTLIDAAGHELDMGTPFDFFGEESHTANASGVAAANRKTLTSAMEAAGFRNYRKEWWHYSLKPASNDGTFHDFPVTGGGR